MAQRDTLLITLPGGRRVDALVGEHRIQTDQPLEGGGEDLAASPFELFLASLGTCAGIFVQGFCAKREIPYDQIRILQRMSYGEDGALSGVDLEVQVPHDFPERYRAALVNVVGQCSVKRALAAQPDISVRVTPSDPLQPSASG